MEAKSILLPFMNAIRQDPHIGPIHVSFFTALIKMWEDQGRVSPIVVYRLDIMEAARIAAISTYHRVLQDLVTGKYILYSPGYSRKGSKIVFLRLS